MKQRRFLVVGIGLFVLLLAADLLQTYLYYESSSRRLDNCLTRSEESSAVSDMCFTISSAADRAFSAATASQIPFYAVIFIFLLTLGSRLDNTEKRLEQMEKDRDV